MATIKSIHVNFHNVALRNVPLTDDVHVSAIDFSSRQLGFSWSPVAPDCEAIHYNILASNCGSCPSITNQTNVTCIDVSINSSTCILAAQTIACGNIIGNISDPVRIIFRANGLIRTPKDNQHPAENRSTQTSDSIVTVSMCNSDTNTVTYVIPISFLMTALIVSIVVSLTLIVIILRSKAKINAALESLIRTEETTQTMNQRMKMSLEFHFQIVLNTQDNVAYHQTQKTEH